MRRFRRTELEDSGWAPANLDSWCLSHYGTTLQGWLRAWRQAVALGTSGGDRAGSAAVDWRGWLKLDSVPPAARSLQIGRVKTPIGPMVALADEEALYLLEFAERRGLENQLRRRIAWLGSVPVRGHNAVMEKVTLQIGEYCEGRRTSFSVPIRLTGTPFQKQAWEALRRIPYGRSVSYRRQARQIGSETAVRAVGRANGDNPLAIIVPCHRLIGSDGRLRGYGGRLWRKRWLLDLEQQRADE